MAFLQMLIKSYNLDKAAELYRDEKLRAVRISEGDKRGYPLRHRLRMKKILLKRKLKKFLNTLLSCPEHTRCHRMCVLLRSEGSMENYILKSVIGFVGGMILTSLFFMFFVFQLNFKLSSATILCSIFGIILTIGLAFSNKVRCIVFLLLPQFFSKRGRQALMAYAFILAITGPAKNALHNTSVLSESLACGQEQLKDTVKMIIAMVKEPFYALKEGITVVLKTIKIIVKKIKESLLAIKRLILSILNIIKSVFQWLSSIINICNKKLGTPFDRCQRVFENAVADCKASLGPVLGGICNLTYLVSAVCYLVKPLDFICMLVSFVSDAIVDAVTKRIATEIRGRTEKFIAVFDWMSFATSFFVFFMLIRVIYYRHKWLTNDRFDNFYLTKQLREIDLIRSRNEAETVLPLNRRERNKYISLTSFTLIESEKRKLTKSAVFLALTTLKLCIHMSADYSLYWMLSMIQYHGRIATKVERPNTIDVSISGEGYLAELYRSIVKAFTPYDQDLKIETIPCLPEPLPPDYDKYTQIVSLIIACWIMTVFEPFGLRIRHIVLGYYYPDRAKQRAVWLYNHILRSRGSFLKFARRQLRRKFGTNDGPDTEKITFMEKLRAICPLLSKVQKDNKNVCLLCAQVEREGQPQHIKCPTPGCVGLFCVQCFSDLQNLCTICRKPMEYGDISDFSEERDSSEDENANQGSKRRPMPLQRNVGDGGKLKDSDEERSDSTPSNYSYSYQDESPEKTSTLRQRRPFKDVEAQKIKDDVEISIFNESKNIGSKRNETDSSNESPRRQHGRERNKHNELERRRKDKYKKEHKSREYKHKKSASETSDAPTSIADTESLPTEELDDDQHLDIETAEDSDDQLLPTTINATKKNKSRGFRKFLSSLIGFGKTKKSPKKKEKKKFRGSKSNKGKRLAHKVTKKAKSFDKKIPLDRIKRKNVNKNHSPITTTRQRRLRGGAEYVSDYHENEEEDDDIHNYLKDFSRNEWKYRNNKMMYQYETTFEQEDLPRHMMPVVQETKYYEVDEISTWRSNFNNASDVHTFNEFSDRDTTTDSDQQFDTDIQTTSNLICTCDELTNEESCSCCRNLQGITDNSSIRTTVTSEYVNVTGTSDDDYGAQYTNPYYK